MKREIFERLFPRSWTRPFWLGALILTVSAVCSWAQTKKQASPPAAQGYLNRAAPANLRFSAPPKPPVASLPAAAIPTDMPPVFSDKFLEKGDLGSQPRPNQPDSFGSRGSKGNGNGNGNGNGDGLGKKPGVGKTGGGKMVPRQSEGELLQMLVKYFERPATGVASTNRTLDFLPPATNVILLAPAPEAPKEKEQ